MLHVFWAVTQCHWVNCSQLCKGLQHLHLHRLRHSFFFSSSENIRAWYGLITEKLPSFLLLVQLDLRLLWVEVNTWLQSYSVHFDPEYTGSGLLNNDKICLQDFTVLQLTISRSAAGIRKTLAVKFSSLRFYYRLVSGRNCVACNKIWSFWKFISV
jgi:site-specific recombinase XerC